jgi:pimeloyl-ACP methyl ester carboxylesterase
MFVMQYTNSLLPDRHITAAGTKSMAADKFLAVRAATLDSGTDSLRLHIRHWAGERRPFVLLHGLASNCRTWERVAIQLATAGHSVVAVDQRGHGLSDKPDSGYDFASICEDLVLLIDALGLEKPIMAGQSWGGNVVLEFGARYPGVAHGLAFVDGGTIDLQMRPDATWERIAAELKPPDLRNVPRQAIKSRIAAMHPDWSDEGLEATLANFETLPDGTLHPWLTLDRHMAILHSLWEQRPVMLYPQVQAPVLICPASDPGNPAWTAMKQQQVEMATRGLRRSSVVWFDQTAHDIHVHRPVELASCFLAELRDGIWAQ